MGTSETHGSILANEQQLREALEAHDSASIIATFADLQQRLAEASQAMNDYLSGQDGRDKQ